MTGGADSAVGAILEIPPGVLEDIDKAEKAIRQLGATSTHVARSVRTDWGETALTGLDAFVKKIKEVNAKLGGIKMPTIDGSGLVSSISEIATAMATVDKSSTTGAARLSRIADAITKLSASTPAYAAFKDIADGIALIGSTSDATIAKVSALATAMATLARDIRTVAAARSADADKTATAAQYNKLYKEQADLTRKINEIKNKGASADLRDLTILSKMQDRWREISDQIDKLNRKKQTAASTLAQFAGANRVGDAQSRTTVSGAIDYAKQAKSLKELQDAYKSLKTVMATVDPKSDAWRSMNTTLQQTKKNIDDIRNKMGEFNLQAQRTSGVASQLRNMLLGAFSVSAIKQYMTQMIKVRAEFELQNVALRAILQNKDEADRIFAQVQQMALQSPFTIMQLTTYTKQLAAYRIEADKLVGTTKMLADVSAGLGVDIQRLILAYGQVKAANYLRATEIRQFTEAGLNIAGELANYFSELQGKMVSVGDVMDMVTKRMVRFEDVEEVFKRVTSAGGLFYDMQKKQAETLSGQIQRISDAYSIMLNDIGKSNQTTISAVLQSIRFLISNWRTVANILSGASVAMAVYAAKTILASVSNKTFAISQQVIVKATYATITALKKMVATLASNPYLIVIAGAAAAGAALLDWKKKVDAVKESYDNMIISSADQQKKLNEIAGRIADSNNRLKDTAKTLNETKRGTSEYSIAVKDNKDALAEQYTILQELRTKFPEVYEGIVKAKDGTIEYTQSLADFSEASRMFAIINTMAKGDATWYNDDFKEDMEEVSAAQEKYNAKLAEGEAYYNSYVALADAIYAKKEAEGTLTQKGVKGYAKIMEIRNSTLSTEEKIVQTAKLGNAGFRELQKASYNLQQSWNKMPEIKLSLTSDVKEAEEEVEAMQKRVLMATGVTTVEEFNKLDESVRKAAERASQMMVKESGIALDEIQRDILHRKWEIPLNMKVVEKPQVEKLSYLQERINEYIASHPEVEMPLITATEETDNYFNGLKKNREQDLKDQKQYNKASVQLTADKTNAQAALDAANRAKARKTMMDYFGVEEKAKAKGKDPWQDRVSLIKEMNTEYEKLLRYYTESEAKLRVQKSYAEAVAEAFKGIKVDGKDLGDIKVWDGFDKKGMIAQLRTVLDSGLTISKEKRAELQKMLAGLKATIDIELQKKAVEKMKHTFDDIFANYDLTKELNNLGLNVDLTYIVGGKPMTLAQARKELQDTYDKALAEGKLGEDAEKAYKDAIKKLDDLEHKAQVERLKNYNKYLLESMSERVQIEMKTQQEIAKIRQSEDLDDTTKQMAILREQQNMKKQLASQQWKDFQGSDSYIQLFEDIEQASTKSIEYVLAKLRNLRGSLKELPADQLRAIMKQIDSLEHQVNTRNPFKALSDNIGTAIKAYKGLAKAEEDFQKIETAYEYAKRTRDDYALYTSQLEQQLQIEESKLDVNELGEKVENDIVRKLKEKIKLRRAELGLMNENVESLEKQKNSIANVIANFKKGKEAVGDSLQEIGSWTKELSNTIGNVANSLENVFGTMSDGTADTVASIQEILGGTSDMLSGIGRAIANPGDIGAYFQAIQGLASTIGSIFAIGDKKKERQIKRLQEKVENLGKAYDKLHDAMDDAYKFDDYNAGFNASMKNLDEQEQAYEELIRLEEAKKKTDKNKVKEYNEALEEIEEARKQLREERYEEMGSVAQKGYKSEAEAFVSTWLDAYKETGDGLDNLTDHWDEFFENLVMKQAASNIISQRMSKYIDQINAAIDSGDTGLSLAQTFAEIGKNLKSELGGWNEDLKAFFDAVGIKGGAGNLILSDLQKGIQNITEPQAAAIEAYLNSMRFAVFEQNNKLDSLIASIQAQYGSGTENPIVTELKGIRSVLDSIDNRLRSVINTQGRNATLRIGTD